MSQPLTDSGTFRVSPEQRRIWRCAGADTRTYVVRCAVAVDRALDPSRLADAARRVARRHEVVRTVVLVPEGAASPVQVVREEPDVNVVPIATVPAASFLTGGAALAQWGASVVDSTADPRNHVPLTIGTATLDDGRGLVVAQASAFCCDGRGLRRLLTEILSLTVDPAHDLPDEVPQYADVAGWLNEMLSAEASTAAHEFWHQFLADAVFTGALSIDGRSDSGLDFRPSFLERHVDVTDVSLRRAADEHRATVESWLLACWLAVLTRCGAPPDICIGVARDCRHRPGLELVPGPLTRFLPVGVPARTQRTVAEAAQQFKRRLTAIGDWGEWFDWSSVDAPDASVSGCSFCFELEEPAAWSPSRSLRCAVVGQQAVTDPCTIKLACRPAGDRLHVTLLWNDARYEAAAIAPLLSAFDALLRDALARPTAAARDLAVLDADERRRVLVDWNATAVSYPPDLLVHDAIGRRAAERPDAVALVSDGAHLSYDELIARARQVTHHLESLGVCRGTPIGLCIERSPELVIGMLAILQAGGAYVPFDPGSPPDRLASMSDDAGLSVVLTTRQVTGRLPSRWWQIVELDAGWPAIARHAPVSAGASAGPEDIAYVIYTSGSTGRPKGVAIPHRALTNHMCWMRDAFPLTLEDRVFQKTPGEFDASVWEFHAPLMAGACLVLARPGGHKLPDYLAETIVREAITVVQFVPSVLRALLEEPALARARSPRQVFVGGEALTPALQRDCFDRWPVDLCNLYGPTEATIDASYWRCTREPAASVPIGRPVSNTACYVLDDEGSPVPVGVPGELYIGGRGLAHGYLGRAALTADCFVPNPFGDEPGARLYRTGDRVRWQPRGTLEYLGRLDHQVKLRGHRIELGEIEAALESHAGVRACAAAVREETAGDRRLLAYVVPDATEAPSIRRWLQLEQNGLRDRHEICELPNGTTIVHHSRNETDFLYEEHFVAGSYCRHGITLADGDCVVDVGANIGMFTMFAARVTRGARLYAFEPVPPTFALLQQNLAVYCPDARAFACGVSRAGGHETFTYYPHLTLMSSRLADPAVDRAIVRTFELARASDGGAARAIDEVLEERLGTSTFDCPVRALSDIIESEQIARIDLLKIDAERSELDVLSGLRDDDWPKVQQVVIEVEDRDGGLGAIVGLLTSRGFDVATEQEDALHGTALWNVFAVRPESRRTGNAIERAREPARDWMGPAAFVEALREHLRRRLPSYAVPARIVLLDRLPVLPNGKVDRARLPAPPADAVYEGPRTPEEQALAQIWGDVLHCARVGRQDDFFALGGHSLVATQVMIRIRQVFDVDLPLRALFESPTIAGLAERLVASRGAAVVTEAPLVPWPRTRPLPLSYAQQRLWFLDQWAPGHAIYNVPYAMRLVGDLDLRAVAQGFTAIVARHEVLRTCFPSVAGEAVQAVQTPTAVPLPIVDLDALGRHATAVAHRLVAAEAHRPFDLARGPVMRVRMLRLGRTVHVLSVVLHHIASDGWSVRILVHELAEAYRAARERRALALPPLPVQYADVSQWQRQCLEGPALETQLAYWRQQLADLPALELRKDGRRRDDDERGVASAPFRIDAAASRRLGSLGRDANVTLFTILVAALHVLLARFTGQRDFAIGTVVANRRHKDVEPLIGFFVNTLVLRARLAGDPTFRELLGRVHETALDAYAHQDVPFERLVEELCDRRDTPRTPLFQVMCALHTETDEPPSLPGVRVETLEIAPADAAKFDLSVFVTASGDEIRGRFEHAPACLAPDVVQGLVGRFEQLLGSFAADAAQSIWTAPLTTARERETLARWSACTAPAPQDDVRAAFERQVVARPDAVALVFEGQHVTYAELRRRSRALASALRTLGVPPDSVVAIDLPRSTEMIVAILGATYAGAGYMALDPTAPAERLQRMIAETRARVVVSRRSSQRARSGDGVECCDVDEVTGDRGDDEPVDAGVGPQRLSNVMYTSGSTGSPKGSAITHGNVVSRATRLDYARLESDDVMLQFGSLAFDASTLEVWGALLNGCRLVLAAAAPSALDRLGAIIRDEQITTTWLTASLFHQMVDTDVDALRGLRQLFTGGEVVSPDHVARAMDALPGCTIINGYGPTENTVFTACHRLTRADLDAGTLPIGTPLASTRAYVVEEGETLAPPYAPGELWVGGPGLARGYIGQPALTAACFVPDGFSGEAGARLYRTGDRVRWRGDGVLEFMGRLDDQVKLRGHRIELREIEVALGEQPGIRHAAVILREDVPGDRVLVAYVVADAARRDVKAWRDTLAARLPTYMVPSAFVLLDTWPLNRNGKLDRRALPAPDAAEGDEDGGRLSPAEEICAGIWAHVLGRASVGRHENFFELGGHSLRATQVMARVRGVFNVDVPLRALFEAPTIAELAARVQDARRLSPAAHPPLVPLPRTGFLPLSFAQQRLWLLDRLAPGQPTYNVPYATRLTGTLRPRVLAQAFTVVVARHDVLRTRFSLMGDEPAQQVDPPAPVPVPLVDLEALAARAEAIARRLAGAEAERPFDLRTGPLLRARLLRLAPGSHVLLLTLHHIVSDGWSIELLVRELGEAYAALVAGREPQLPELPIQYGDFAQWQRRALEAGVLDAQLAYWRRQLADLPVLELRSDGPRRAAHGRHDDAVLTLSIPSSVARRLRARSREAGATLFMTLFAAFEVVLARFSGQRDFAIGTVIANRPHADVEPLIGFFINTLVLRTTLADDPTFRDLVDRVRETALDAYANRDVPFDRLTEALRPGRASQHSPLIRTLLALHSLTMAAPRILDVRAEAFAPPPPAAKWDLALYLDESASDIAGAAYYRADLLRPATVQSILDAYLTLLTLVADDWSCRVFDVPLVDAAAQAVDADAFRTQLDLV